MTFATNSIIWLNRNLQDERAYYHISRLGHQRFIDLGWPWIWHQPAYLAAYPGLCRIPYHVPSWCITSTPLVTICLLFL